jgi:hypothetical protein
VQHELFPAVPFSIDPEAGRAAPRFWVQRLVIFQEPGKIIRDIGLKPGLNIVWSPDPGAAGIDPIGHGGGKTMFCRLLRYCLGEDAFAPDGQRRRVWDKFPKGMIGAEVIVDGKCWAVLRSLAHRAQDRVVADARSIIDAFEDNRENVGIEAFRKVLSDTFLEAAARLMPATIGEAHAWQSTLAWATRDQECRFAHPLEWRDPNTDSHSPVRGRSKDDLLLVIRACVGALSPQELLARQREEAEAATLSSARHERNGLDWQIKRSTQRFRITFGENAITDASTLETAVLKAVAIERLQGVLNLPAGSPTNLERAREQRDIARARLRLCEDEFNDGRSRIEEKQRALSFMRAELIEASAEYQTAGNPVCPICRVPIDAVLAEGCKISLEKCDLDGLRRRNDARKTEMDAEQTEIVRLEGREGPLKHEIAMAKQQLERLESNVTALERALLDKARGIREAERLVDDIDRYSELLEESVVRNQAINDAEARLESARREVTALRDEATKTIQALSERFGAVIRELVPGDVTGRLVLDGNGLALRVELGGDRSTAAIDSWKIVAFDLAVLTMTVEGRTRLPAFLLHDSPREADLGISLYARLFGFMKKLESFGPAPLFQYIVTTTTEPPLEFQSDPWLRLRLRGAPAQDRLLGIDL